MPPVSVRVFTSIIPSAVAVAPTEADLAVTLDSATDNITANNTAVGGAIPLTTKINHVTTVSAANDSVILPPAISGLSIIVNNGSANNVGVFPQQNNDNINGGSNNAVYSQATGTVAYRCYTTGKWVTG